MKISSAECLLCVAIVTSAVVAHIRMQTMPSAEAGVPATQTQSAQREARVPSCDEAHSGLLRAACETARDQHPIDSNDGQMNRAVTPRTSTLWV